MNLKYFNFIYVLLESEFEIQKQKNFKASKVEKRIKDCVTNLVGLGD